MVDFIGCINVWLNALADIVDHFISSSVYWKLKQINKFLSLFRLDSSKLWVLSLVWNKIFEH